MKNAGAQMVRREKKWVGDRRWRRKEERGERREKIKINKIEYNNNNKIK